MALNCRCNPLGRAWLTKFLSRSSRYWNLTTWNGRKSVAVRDFLTRLVWCSCGETVLWVGAVLRWPLHTYIWAALGAASTSDVLTCTTAVGVWGFLDAIWLNGVSGERSWKCASRCFRREVWKGGTFSSRDCKWTSFSCRIQRHGNTQRLHSIA